MVQEMPERKPGRKSKWLHLKPRIIALLRDPAHTIRGVARDEGVPESTIRGWITATSGPDAGGTGSKEEGNE